MTIKYVMRQSDNRMICGATFHSNERPFHSNNPRSTNDINKAFMALEYWKKNETPSRKFSIEEEEDVS